MAISNTYAVSKTVRGKCRTTVLVGTDF